MRPRSFYYKLVIFGCLLCSLPVLFIGTFSYLNSSSQIQSQVNSGKALLLRQTASNVEQIMKTLDHTLNQVANSTLMNDALSRPLDVYDFQIYDDLRNELSYLQSFDIKVADVIVFNAERNWYLQNSGLYRFDEVPQYEQLLQQFNLPANSNWRLYPSSLFYNKENDYSGCEYNISLVKKLPVQSFEKTGLTFANIPTCRIADMILSDHQSEEMIILDENHHILVHRDPDWIGKSIADTGFVDSLETLASNQGQFEATLEDGTYSVNHIRSEYNGWTYLSVISLDELTRDSKMIGWFTLITCLVILLVSLALVWLGSRRMYSPIHRLLNKLGETLPESPSKKMGEFQFIDEQLQHLFHSKSELEQQIHKHLQQVQTFTLIKLYNGQIRPADIAARLRDIEVDEPIDQWRQMAVLTVQIDTLRETRYTAKDLDLLLFAINNMIEDLIPVSRRFPPIVMEQTQVTLVGDPIEPEEGNEPSIDAEAFQSYLYTITESIQQTVMRLLNLQVSIGVSLPFTSVSEASRAYLEGTEALKQRIKLGDGVIIQYADLNHGNHSLRIHFPEQVERELFDAIKLADEEKSADLLKELIHTVIQGGDAPREFQIQLIRLLNDLMVMLQEAGISLTQIRAKGSPYEELLQLHTSQDVEEWFLREMISPLLGIFRDRRESQFHNLSEKIIHMIHEGYDTDLTLEGCAAELHYNVNYLSSVFRKETQLTFSEYLSKHRFKMAKKWLAETDMTIREISERLQYNNSQNFIRSFRKLEGMTPGHYRKQFEG